MCWWHAVAPLLPNRYSSSLSFYYFASHWHESQNIVVLSFHLNCKVRVFVDRQLADLLGNFSSIASLCYKADTPLMHVTYPQLTASPWPISCDTGEKPFSFRPAKSWRPLLVKFTVNYLDLRANNNFAKFPRWWVVVTARQFRNYQQGNVLFCKITHILFSNLR